MHRRVEPSILVVALLLGGRMLLVPSTVSAQYAAASPGVGTVTPEWMGGLDLTAARQTLASALAASVDSTRRYPRSWWLEGGLVGALLLGSSALQMFRGMTESELSISQQAGAYLYGAMVGFPVGALIGGLIPKARSP